MTANLSREQELAFWREKTEQLRVRVMEIARKANPMDAAFPRSLEGTLNEWSSEADDEAQRRAGELDSGIVRPVPAEEVARKARALLG